MRNSLVFLLSLAFGAAKAEPGDESVKKYFQNHGCKVTWGVPADYKPNAVLEIGEGEGHAGTLGWIRFQPSKGGVSVLSIQFDEGWKPYDSKWPPDRAPVLIKSGRLKPDVYAKLLRRLAIIDAARVKLVAANRFTVSSRDFWVSARIELNGKTLLDYDWAGYENSSSAAEYLQPAAAVSLVRDAIKEFDLKEHNLTAAERAWASKKFSHDWVRFKNEEFHWWVRERYIIVIGVVGDKAALPTLRDALKMDPKNRCVYHAINAITRLIGKDVREKPIEEMDVEKIRRRVLDLIRKEK